MNEKKDSEKICSIIIPTFNEAGNITNLISKIEEVSKRIFDYQFEIIIVDDGSTDQTIPLITNLKKKISVTLIKRNKKLGIGSAYRTAFPQTHGNLIAIMDADFSHNPDDLVQLISVQTDDPNMIIWSTRYAKGGKIVGWGPLRKLISCTANFLARYILKIPISDVTSAFRVYQRSIFQKIIMTSKSNGFSFQMEASFLATQYHSTNIEIPVIFHDREVGRSKFSFHEIVEFLYTLLYLLWMKLFFF